MTDDAHLFRYGSPEADFGPLGYTPITVSSRSERFVVVEHGVPTVYGFSGARIMLEVSRAERVRLFGEELADEAVTLEVTLSPDGDTVAAFVTVAYVVDGEIPLHHVHAVAFFDAVTGDYMRGQALDWRDDIDPHLDPFPTSLPYRPRMLWRHENDGVYVLDGETAKRVTLAETPGIETVTDVPARPVPTAGGPVSVDGFRVVQVQEGNGAWLEAERVADWITHDAIDRVPLGDVDYVLPVDPLE